jgi:hypothetical protein
MKIDLRVVGAVATLLIVRGVAHADVIVDNLGPGSTYVTYEGIAVENGLNYTQSVAELFVSPGNYYVTQIDIALIFIEGQNADGVSLWTANGHSPGTELGSWTASPLPSVFSSYPTGTITDGQVISVTGVSLSAGYLYFLVADVPAFGTSLFWGPVNPMVFTENIFVSENGGPWIPAGTADGAYAVFGTRVPEPSTWAMMLLSRASASQGIAGQGRATQPSPPSSLAKRSLAPASATLAAVRAMRTGRKLSARGADRTLRHRAAARPRTLLLIRLTNPSLSQSHQSHQTQSRKQ